MKTKPSPIVRLIPGVRQDHTGFNYQIGYTASGHQVQVPVELPPLSERLMAALQPMEVQSQTTKQTYRTLACFQRRM